MLSPLSTYAAPDRVAGPNTEPMLAVRPPTRAIEEIPALLVMLLNDSGKLPPIPNLPQAGVVGFRRPELTDMQTLRYVASWDGAKLCKDGFRRVAGLASFRDVFDWHTSSEVRELVALRGSPRSCAALISWLIEDGLANCRRLVGAVQLGDAGLRALAERLGCAVTREWMEYAA